jgi:O-antigen/teichoic acid export membrane protein
MDHRREVYRNTAAGAIAFVLREVLVFPLGIVVSIVLARLLSPADFGTFATTLFALSSLAGVLELGLGAAVVRQPEAPSDRDLRTLFTFRLAAMGTLFLVFWVAAPIITMLFKIGPHAESFVRLVATSLLVTPFSGNSRNLLSRGLAYRTLASVDMAQTVTYQLVALLLAWQGYGLWGLGIAHLVASLVQAILLHAAAPWRLGFGCSRRFLHASLTFGGLVQLSSMTYLVRDNIPVLLAGPLFGPSAVGYLNWGLRMVRQVTHVLTSAVTRVSFPSMARLQHDRGALTRIANGLLRTANLLTLPLLSAVCALAPEIVHLLYTDKWAPGLPALYLWAICLAAGNVTTPLDSLLKATDRAGASLKVMSVWTAVDWALAVPAVALFGFTGVAVAYAIGSWLAATWLLRHTSPQCDLDLYHCLVRPVAAATLACGAVVLLKGSWITSIPLLLCAGALTVGLAWLILLVWERAALVDELKLHWGFAREALGARR